MSSTLPDRRRIAVLDGERRLDLALPYDDSLAEAFEILGIRLEPGRHLVLERSGKEAELTATGADLAEGALFAVVDLTAVPPVSGRRRRVPGAAAVRAEFGAPWWMLVALSVVVVAIEFGAPSAGPFADPVARVAVAVVLGLAAASSAVVWSRRRTRDTAASAVAMAGPLALAFGCGVVAVPSTLDQAAHLAAVTGLLAAAVLSSILVVTLRGSRLRAAAGSATAILLGLVVIWGLTLLTQWGVVAAAAISMGVVAPALRALPSTLLNVPEGYFIDYARFMSSRWTVRGAIPDDPGRVRMEMVREVVDQSSSRLAVGTTLLSATAAVCAPFVLTSDLSDPVVLSGTIALAVTVVLALLLIPRRTASPVLRWIPRAAAALVMVTAVVAVLRVLDTPVELLGAGGLLLVGVIGGFVVIPIARGANSLGWSRAADLVEAFAIALALPAALLAADALSLLRGMMAA